MIDLHCWFCGVQVPYDPCSALLQARAGTHPPERMTGPLYHDVRPWNQIHDNQEGHIMKEKMFFSPA